ncbi:hypothetical protein CI109_103072 [Kwoniella shandongensis]|uniref:Uncharacterized protein n=1 Tax=Kwoniella shandongensis TaxID=1734106 RepID=A0A5M6CC67_9TREE|nr:uncharacterized protein CI109_000263 [Kwoniella shandongensis]KAA5531422.1 hypothetical protein CI109_000263 [Kwoniella shandongensis]
MAPLRTIKNILMELRKVCQHPYISAPELESLDIPEEEQQKQLINASGKLMFLKLLLPKLKQRGHRVLLFSQFKIALDRIEDFLYGEGINFLRLDGDIQQAQRQKSMDLFNAPNSEYDVFLLTTRAGGVGINLATADTVILYDPDFNPHQDLQAIARSHRYGQKKKVLVFRLMIKGSVEENIINKGKKKMVLDHLVVQQMDKENEEGEIDDLLLRGAEAVYGSDGGINAPDITYSSKNVDELIDKVEAEAEAEAKALEEREKAKERGESEAGPSRQSMQFGFAKIWEADQNQLREAEEEGAEEVETVETNWQEIFDNMQKERQARLTKDMEAERQTRRIRKAMENPYAVALVDDSPGRKKRRSAHWKGKGKAVDGGGSSSDADFAINPDEQSDDDDDIASFTSVPEALSGLVTDNDGNAVTRGLVGPQKMRRKERQLWEQAQAQAQARIAVANGEVPVASGSGTQPDRVSTSTTVPKPKKKETPEERAARKAVEKPPRAAQRREVAELERVFAEMDRIRRETAGHSHNLALPQDDRLVGAQNIISWLYQMLQELGMQNQITTWAKMALLELPVGERVGYYSQLATMVDNRLIKQWQEAYFSRPDQCVSVIRLFKAGVSVIPDRPTVPPMPKKVGIERNGEGGVYAQPNGVPSAQSHNPVVTQPSTQLQANHTFGAPPPVAAVNTVAPPVFALSQPPPHTHPAQINRAPRPSSQLANPASRVPNGHTSSSSHQQLLTGLMDVADETCEHCNGGHPLRDCDRLPSVADIDMWEQAILHNNEPERQKRDALSMLNRLRFLNVKAGRAVHTARQAVAGPSANSNEAPAPGGSRPIQQVSSNGNASQAKTPLRANGHANGHSHAPTPGTREAAIVIDDDDENTFHKNGTASQTNGHTSSQTAAVTTKSKKAHPIHGCAICQSPNDHNAIQCPVVQAGPDSMANALARLGPDHPLYSVVHALWLKQSHQPQPQQIPLCPFCETRCGRDIKSCVEAHGGRKLLKNKIRTLQSHIEGKVEGWERMKLMSEELYAIYLMWPK